MSLGHGPKVTTSGLILCLDAANTKSYPGTGTDWFDLSGNGNHAVLTDAPTFSNGTLQFDGISQYATVDGGIRTQIDAGSASTIIAIANMKSIEHVDNLIGWGNANTALTWGLYSKSGVLRAGYQGAALGNAGAIGNQWVFLAARFDATDTYATVRGNLTDVDATVGKGVYDWHGIGTGNPVTICKTSYYARWMEADVSAIYVYDTFLTDTQLEQHYNALRGRFGI